MKKEGSSVRRIKIGPCAACGRMEEVRITRLPGGGTEVMVRCSCGEQRARIETMKAGEEYVLEMDGIMTGSSSEGGGMHADHDSGDV